MTPVRIAPWAVFIMVLTIAGAAAADPPAPGELSPETRQRLASRSFLTATRMRFAPVVRGLVPTAPRWLRSRLDRRAAIHQAAAQRHDESGDVARALPEYSRAAILFAMTRNDAAQASVLLQAAHATGRL